MNGRARPRLVRAKPAAVAARKTIALILLTLTACSPAKTIKQDAAECEMEALRASPQGADASSSNYGPYLKACMKARGYTSFVDACADIPVNAPCLPDACYRTKDMYADPACYHRD
jgi:hypothetical protein